MNWRELGSFLILTIAVITGFAIQAYLVQIGHQDAIYGYVAGVLVYQTLSDPHWFREIDSPDTFVSVLVWVLFPFAATFGFLWRIIFLERR